MKPILGIVAWVKLHMQAVERGKPRDGVRPTGPKQQTYKSREYKQDQQIETPLVILRAPTWSWASLDGETKTSLSPQKHVLVNSVPWMEKQRVIVKSRPLLVVEGAQHIACLSSTQR